MMVLYQKINKLFLHDCGIKLHGDVYLCVLAVAIICSMSKSRAHCMALTPGEAHCPSNWRNFERHYFHNYRYMKD